MQLYSQYEGSSRKKLTNSRIQLCVLFIACLIAGIIILMDKAGQNLYTIQKNSGQFQAVNAERIVIIKYDRNANVMIQIDKKQ